MHPREVVAQLLPVGPGYLLGEYLTSRASTLATSAGLAPHGVQNEVEAFV